VVAGKPYDPNVPVTNLECTGHVQEIIGSRLRRLVKEKRGTKLHDSKPFGGKGRLTQSEIDSHQDECQQFGGHEESCVGSPFSQVVNK
jgi:hypothetical protein